MADQNLPASRTFTMIQHLQCVYTHPSFREDYTTLKTQIDSDSIEHITNQPHVLANQLIKNFCERWLITNNELIDFERKQDQDHRQANTELRNLLPNEHAVKPIPITLPVAAAPLAVVFDGKEIILKVGRHTTLNDIITNWRLVNDMQQLVYGPKSKMTGATDYEFVLAIHIQRNYGLTFSAIKRLCDEDIMPSYKMTPRTEIIAESVENLRNYYTRNIRKLKYL